MSYTYPKSEDSNIWQKMILVILGLVFLQYIEIFTGLASRNNNFINLQYVGRIWNI